MRGPGHKWVNQIRRTWRCPACGYERHVSGVETTVRCRCAEGPFMKLVAEPRFHRPVPKPVNIYFEAEELLGLGDGGVAPPAAAPATTADELGAEPSTAVAAADAPAPAAPHRPRTRPAEEESSAASGDETTSAPALRNADARPPERGGAAGPGGSIGGGRSPEGSGRRPRDQRRRGGRPRGPQAPRE